MGTKTTERLRVTHVTLSLIRTGLRESPHPNDPDLLPAVEKVIAWVEVLG